MTEKRFNLRAGYYHNYTGICSDTDENLTTNNVVDLLNEQGKTIKELEKDLNDALNRIEERSIDVQLLKEENGNLKKENELKGDFRNFINEDIVRIKKENEKLKKYNKGQELEIVRLHTLADAMSAVLRELGIYDVYNDEQIENVKRRIINV